MKKILISTLLLISFSCKTVDDWSIEPVLLESTVIQAENYVKQQEKYLTLVDSRDNVSLPDNLSIEELDKRLKEEKEIAISSQNVLNAWFDFFLVLRQDPGFNSAYSGHYYFRKAFEALSYRNKTKNRMEDSTLKDSIFYEEILLIESKCRLAIGEIVAYNITSLETDKLYSKLKKLYKSMD